MTEREVIDILRIEYPPPAWAFLDHVPDGTGAYKLRTSDAMAMSLWPSRGLELSGFEVKVSRSDWLRERKDPAKADELVSRCHHWWLVVSEEDMVQPGELPPTWGLMVVDGKKLTIVTPAPLLAPPPPDWTLFAAVLRRTAEAWVSREEVRKRKEKRVGEQPRREPTAEEVKKWLGMLDRMGQAVSRVRSEVGSARAEIEGGYWDLLNAERRIAEGERS